MEKEVELKDYRVGNERCPCVCASVCTVYISRAIIGHLYTHLFHLFNPVVVRPLLHPIFLCLVELIVFFSCTPPPHSKIIHCFSFPFPLPFQQSTLHSASSQDFKAKYFPYKHIVFVPCHLINWLKSFFPNVAYLCVPLIKSRISNSLVYNTLIENIPPVSLFSFDTRIGYQPFFLENLVLRKKTNIYIYIFLNYILYFIIC